MTAWEIPLPVRRDDERLNVRAIGELPDILDGDDREVCRELLLFFREVASPQTCTVGQVAAVLEDFSRDERKSLLGILRSRAGLPNMKSIDALAAAEAASAANRVRMAHDTRPPRIAFNPSGGFVDLNEADDDTAREQARQASLAAQRDAEHDERAIEAEERAAYEAARDARVDSELPAGFPR